MGKNHLLLILGALLLAAPLAAEEPKWIPCESVVQTFQPGAMHDHLRGSEFRVYDAVVFKLGSPASKAGTELRILLEVGTVNRDSSLRKPGSRYRFDLLNHATQEQLFIGAVRNLAFVPAGRDVVPEKFTHS